jgi:DNA-binding CsgD family transcriptional regulator
VFFDFFAPSLRNDEKTRRWWARYQRFCASPSAVAASLRMHVLFDGRSLLPGIRAATLVLHHADDLIVPVACGRYLADHIEGAKFLELAGSDHLYWVGDQDTLLGHVHRFLESLPDAIPQPTGRRGSGLPTFGWEALTPAERDIVELVRNGMSNKEIAARLFVSSKTVEAHLSHVFAKLGVDTRAMLAAEATQLRQ